MPPPLTRRGRIPSRKQVRQTSRIEIAQTNRNRYHIKEKKEDDDTLLPWECESELLGVHAEQSGRQTMEDRHVIRAGRGLGVEVFAVFDGHGGFSVAQFLQDHFAEAAIQAVKEVAQQHDTRSNLGKQKLAKRLAELFLDLDRAMALDPHIAKMQPNSDGVGSTVCALLYLKNTSQLVMVNVGDSRCVWYGPGLELAGQTIDHKPTEAEEKRILAQGGRVTHDSSFGVDRVGGELAMSRALGDHSLKGGREAVGRTARLAMMRGRWANWHVLPLPDVTIVDLPRCRKPTRRAELNGLTRPMLTIALASDGLWDVSDAEELGKSISLILDQKISAVELVRAAINLQTPQTVDNTTLVVIRIPLHGKLTNPQGIRFDTCDLVQVPTQGPVTRLSRQPQPTHSKRRSHTSSLADTSLAVYQQTKNQEQYARRSRGNKSRGEGQLTRRSPREQDSRAEEKYYVEQQNYHKQRDYDSRRDRRHRHPQQYEEHF
jgi:serine/threonine protein phosphatase PrpC